MDTVSSVAVAGEPTGALSATVPLDAQMGNASGADWQEEVYQKIKSMKEMYLLRLNDLYHKVASKVQQHDSLRESPQNDQIEEVKMLKMMLEHIMLFLRLNKHDIQPARKEKLLSVERHISFFLSSNSAKLNNIRMNLSRQQNSNAGKMLLNQRLTKQCNHLLIKLLSFEKEQLMQMWETRLQQGLFIAQQHNALLTYHEMLMQEQSVRHGSQLKSARQLHQAPSPQVIHHPSRQNMLTSQEMLMQQQSVSHRSQLKSAGQLHQAPSPQPKKKIKVEGDVTLRMEIKPEPSTVEGGADWQEEVYQKIKSMREAHLLEINDVYQKIASKVQQDSLPLRLQHEQIEKLKMFKMTLEHIVRFLRLNKHEIQLRHKEELFVVEKHISFFLSFKQPHKPTSSQLQVQLPQPSMHTRQVVKSENQD